MARAAIARGAASATSGGAAAAAASSARHHGHITIGPARGVREVSSAHGRGDGAPASIVMAAASAASNHRSAQRTTAVARHQGVRRGSFRARVLPRDQEGVSGARRVAAKLVQGQLRPCDESFRASRPQGGRPHGSNSSSALNRPVCAACPRSPCAFSWACRVKRPQLHIQVAQPVASRDSLAPLDRPGREPPHRKQGRSPRAQLLRAVKHGPIDCHS